jgi:hypothetical protein
MLKPGDKAPDFTLLDQDGNPFTLSKSLRRKVRHLVYFYPWSCSEDEGRHRSAGLRGNQFFPRRRDIGFVAKAPTADAISASCRDVAC